MSSTILERLFGQEKLLSEIKGSRRGDTCIVVGCSPYLMNYPQSELREVLSQHTVMCIKQAYDLYPELCDIHVFNCCNAKTYKYATPKPLVVECSTLVPSENDFDLFFFVKDRSLSQTTSYKMLKSESFDVLDSTQLDSLKSEGSMHCLPKPQGSPESKAGGPKKDRDDIDEIEGAKTPIYVRPYGPGILSEICFPLCAHLGFSRMILIGCDNTCKPDKTHFYRGSDDLSKYIESNDPHAGNPNVPFSQEAKIFRNSILYWYNWLNKHGCRLQIVSSVCPFSKAIPRITLNDV